MREVARDLLKIAKKLVAGPMFLMNRERKKSYTIREFGDAKRKRIWWAIKSNTPIDFSYKGKTGKISNWNDLYPTKIVKNNTLVLFKGQGRGGTDLFLYLDSINPEESPAELADYRWKASVMNKLISKKLAGKGYKGFKYTPNGHAITKSVDTPYGDPYNFIGGFFPEEEGYYNLKTLKGSPIKAKASDFYKYKNDFFVEVKTGKIGWHSYGFFDSEDHMISEMNREFNDRLVAAIDSWDDQFSTVIKNLNGTRLANYPDKAYIKTFFNWYNRNKSSFRNRSLDEIVDKFLEKDK